LRADLLAKVMDFERRSAERLIKNGQLPWIMPMDERSLARTIRVQQDRLDALSPEDRNDLERLYRENPNSPKWRECRHIELVLPHYRKILALRRELDELLEETR
jgi:hypothetical protein